jgi:indole-3-acetate monooxygenase
MSTVPATALSDLVPSQEAEPSLFDIARSLEPVIRQYADQAEQERTIPPALVDVLYETGVFRTFLPRELGGLEVNPVEWLDMVEELSRVNGSVGWLAMINAGGTRLPPAVVREIMAAHGRWIAASNLGRIGGRAYRVEGGYRVSGRWPFASGCPHSVFFSGQSLLCDDSDQPVLNPDDGQPVILFTTWPIEPGHILDTWDGLGLRGTGSHDIVVEDQFVPDRFVSAGMRDRVYPGPLYSGQFLFMAHAAHAVGIARAAIDAFVELCNLPPAPGSRRQSSLGKTQTQQVAAGRADALVRAARLFAWDATARAYEAATLGEAIPYDVRILMGESMVFAVRSSKEAVDLVYEAAGASSVYHGTTLERCFRDIHTAAQHIIVTENRYDSIGQYYLTKDQPEGPRIEGIFPF